jgi:AraC-like DNA-binding protein
MENCNICKFNLNRSGDISCADFVYETGNALGVPHEAARYMLCIVTGGRGELCQRDVCHELHRGDLFFVLRGERFSISGDGLSYCYISFSGRRAEELVDRVGVNARFCLFEGFEALCDFWMDVLHKADEGNTDLFAEGVLLYTMAHLKPDSRPQSDLITKMVMLSNDRFTQADFSLAALARELGYDAKYLSALFKKKKVITYSRYLRELRIRHAIFLIEQGVASVKNVALLSGFADALYFSKVFTAEQGISPKAYIASVASRAEK